MVGGRGEMGRRESQRMVENVDVNNAALGVDESHPEVVMKDSSGDS